MKISFKKLHSNKTGNDFYIVVIPINEEYSIEKILTKEEVMILKLHNVNFD